mmetsp:Transcript_14775/g.29842  ORF Transcript_14775/g.29842 Transcript_14775/m.29842 type:complete len:467 (-) Transcript_14775:420-1820(-)
MKIILLGTTAALTVRTGLAFAPVGHPAAASRISSSDTCTDANAPFSTQLSAYVDINEGTGRDVGAMDQWATGCGVQRAGGFQLTSEDGLDFSVMTTEALPEGSPLLYVPEQMVLSSNKAKQELEAMGNVQEAVSQLGRLGAGTQVSEFYLFLKVLVEYEKGDASPWYPWLNSLPRLFYNAVSMTDFCLECLPPYAFALSRGERVKFDNVMNVLQKVDAVSPSVKENKELCRWAFNIVHTRAFGPDDNKHIAPMGDMFNHGTETEVSINYNEDGSCSAFTTRDVPAGSPLRASYGCPTNPSFFFATYGFLDETSPASFCKIMNITPNPQLLDLGYDFSRMLFYKDTGDISEEVWDVMLYQILGTKNRDVQQTFYNAHMAGDANTKQQIHQQYFADTSTALQTHVDTFLKQLDALSEKGRGKNYNEHPRLPLILKHNEFVRETFLRVKANLDPMVAQAGGVREPVGAF